MIEGAYAGIPVLVTGGMGFVGSNLVRHLVALGARVTVLDALSPHCGGNPFNLDGVRDDVTVLVQDQGDEQAMRRLVTGFDRIFNLVGHVNHVSSMADPYADLYSNVTAHVALLEACRHEHRNVKLVICGTRGQYGRPAELPVDERAPAAPIDVNGINKHAGEAYHFLYGRSYGFRVCSLRLTNTYGPRHAMNTAGHGVFAAFLRQALDGQVLPLFGGGQQLRDFNHVDDVCRALLLAMARPEADGQIFNLGSAEPVSLRRVAELIVEHAGSGRAEAVRYPDALKPLEIGDYVGDYGKIRRVLGWEPRVSLDQGVRETVEYYRRYRDHYWRAG